MKSADMLNLLKAKDSPDYGTPYILFYSYKGMNGMTNLEKMEQHAYEEGVDIDYVAFQSERIKGLYCDRSIAINRSLKSQAEKSCVLAEELGHYHTTEGNILDPSKDGNRKQERLARLWAYDSHIGLEGLTRAYEAGCRSRYEIAEYLDVTEAFLQDAIELYRQKYGPAVHTGPYTILFQNGISIIKSL